MKIASREVRLKQRPRGIPDIDDFEIVEVMLPAPQINQVLVRNIYMSVDPYMRNRMGETKSYLPSFQVDKPMLGGCVGEIVDSKNEHFQKGDYVLGFRGWREYYISSGKGLTTLDPSIAPIQSYLGVLGMPGLTAYVGLLDIGGLKEGETVFVSAAAGAVGSLVCQIAKIKGCRVVASAGTNEKVEWLMEEAKVDAAFNYKEVEKLRLTLGEHCPDGIDLYFENVGGEHLEAAIFHMNTFGRIVVCGMISMYNNLAPEAGPRNLPMITTKRLLIKGFLVSDHYDREPMFLDDMREWIAAGAIIWRETIVEGIENAPRAFLGLFKGENIGKMLVQVGSHKAPEVVNKT